MSRVESAKVSAMLKRAVGQIAKHDARGVRKEDEQREVKLPKLTFLERRFKWEDK